MSTTTDKLNIYIEIIKRVKDNSTLYYLKDNNQDVILLNNKLSKNFDEINKINSSKLNFKNINKTSEKREINNSINTYIKNNINRPEFKKNLEIYTEVKNNDYEIYYDSNCLADFVLIKNWNNFDWKDKAILIDNDSESEFLKALMTQIDTDKYKIPIPIKKIDSQDKHICHKIDVSGYNPDLNKLNKLVGAIGDVDEVPASLDKNIYVIIDVDTPNDYKPIDKLKNIILYKDHDGNKISTVYKKPSENTDKDKHINESEKNITNIINKSEESYSENKTMREVTSKAEEAAEKAITEANAGNSIETKEKMEEAMRAAKIAYFGIDPKVVQVGGNAETSQEALRNAEAKYEIDILRKSVNELFVGNEYNNFLNINPFSERINIGRMPGKHNIENKNNDELEENIVNLKNTAKTISEEREKALELANEINEEKFAAEAAGISACSSEFIGRMISLNERQMAINDINSDKLYEEAVAGAAVPADEEKAQDLLRDSLKNVCDYLNTGYDNEAQQGLNNKIEGNAEEAAIFNYAEFEDTIKNNKEEAYKEEQKIGISKFYDDELAKLKNEHKETSNNKDREANAAVNQQKKLFGMIGYKTSEKKEEAHEATEKAMTEINTHRDIGVKKIEAEIEAALANKDKMEYEKTKYEKNENVKSDLDKLKNLTNCGSKFTKIYDQVYPYAELANEVLIKISHGTAVPGGFITTGIAAAADDINQDTVKDIIKERNEYLKDINNYVTKENLKDLDDNTYANTIIISTIEKACEKTVDAYKASIDGAAGAVDAAAVAARRDAANEAALAVGDRGHIAIPAGVKDSGFNRIVILRDIIKDAAANFIEKCTDFTNVDNILTTNKVMIDNALKIAFANAVGDRDVQVVAAGPDEPLVGEAALNRDQLLPENGALDSKINTTSNVAIAILLKLLVDSKGKSSLNVDNYTNKINRAEKKYNKLIESLKNNAKDKINSYHKIHGEGKLVMYVIDPFDLLKGKNDICTSGEQKGTYDKDGHFHHILKTNALGQINTTSLQSGGGISNSFNIQSDNFLQSLFKKITQ